MKLDDLAPLAPTYAEIGATAGQLPDGYHHVQMSAVIGNGRRRFEEAAANLMKYGMFRGAGMQVDASTKVISVGTDLLVGVGSLRAPSRVVYVLDEPERRGFAIGTLPRHAVSGEELFAIRYDSASDKVYAEATAFYRPVTWWSRLGAPIIFLASRVNLKRYLRAA